MTGRLLYFVCKSYCVPSMCLSLLCQKITYYANNVNLDFSLLFVTTFFDHSYVLLFFFFYFSQSTSFVVSKTCSWLVLLREFHTDTANDIFVHVISLTHFITWHLAVMNALCPCLDEECCCHVNLVAIWEGCRGSLQYRVSVETYHKLKSCKISLSISS